MLIGIAARAQFTDCSMGLLQMPTAEMPEDGTFSITNNMLNRNSLPTLWGQDTFQYGFTLSYWRRFELGFVFTLFDGSKSGRKDEYWQIMRNQDRHLFCRILLLREGEFGFDWLPSFLVGFCDPVTGVGGDYLYGNVKSLGNGYFNRTYFVASKHFSTPYGELGGHAGYQYSVRKDYVINGPCVGVNWKPTWLQDKGILDDLNVIAEFDSRTLNLGCIATIWDGRFQAMFELQNLRWVNFGLRYQLKLKKIKVSEAPGWASYILDI